MALKKGILVRFVAMVGWGEEKVLMAVVVPKQQCERDKFLVLLERDI